MIPLLMTRSGHLEMNGSEDFAAADKQDSLKSLSGGKRYELESPNMDQGLRRLIGDFTSSIQSHRETKLGHSKTGGCGEAKNSK